MLFPIQIHTRDCFIIAAEPGVGEMLQIPTVRNLVLSRLCFWLRLKSFPVVSVTKQHAGLGSKFEITRLLFKDRRSGMLNFAHLSPVSSVPCQSQIWNWWHWRYLLCLARQNPKVLLFLVVPCTWTAVTARVDFLVVFSCFMSFHVPLDGSQCTA